MELRLNKDKEISAIWNAYIGSKYKVWGTRYDDVKKNATGIYVGKHVDIPMHYILLDGEEDPRLFHIFEIERIYEGN